MELAKPPPRPRLRNSHVQLAWEKIKRMAAYASETNRRLNVHPERERESQRMNEVRALDKSETDDISPYIVARQKSTVHSVLPIHHGALIHKLPPVRLKTCPMDK